jgi:hypothetical protein
MSEFDAGWLWGAAMMACLWLSAIGLYQWARWRKR